MDRAITYARAEIVCLVQDDDQIPCGAGWLEPILQRFTDDPALAVVGGFMGFESFHPDPATGQTASGEATSSATSTTSTSARTSSAGSSYEAARRVGPLVLRCPASRASASTSEFCLRAWTEGYRVGYSFVPFKGPPGHYAMDGGTMVFTPHVRERNRIVNTRRIYETYRSRSSHIDRLVEQANAEDGSRA